MYCSAYFPAAVQAIDVAVVALVAVVLVVVLVAADVVVAAEAAAVSVVVTAGATVLADVAAPDQGWVANACQVAFVHSAAAAAAAEKLAWMDWNLKVPRPHPLGASFPADQMVLESSAVVF